ncbi:protein MAIN-LIKE 2-like isoform X1 [Lycium ferocissimum]|uniref:protein MAIN-LIKE 2-like isoform X1 n=2 Tax=Lycium ferocissimum TaxID=112874 RepID=UPI00281565ED|nr:protein MAIN-LIKE 2-like isoform X1 [Lycium ferocissimum]
MRKNSMLQKSGVKSVGNFSTRFSLPSFVKRVMKLTDSQKVAISRTGFGNLLLIPTQTLSKNLLDELMQRWDYEKRAFVFPPGEITISLLDIALILGLRGTGNPVILREDTPFLDLEREYGVGLWNRKITVASLEKRLDSLGDSNNDDFVRSFLLYMFGTFLFPNTNGKIDSRYVYLLRDIDQVNNFAWGTAVLADVFHWLYKRKKEKVQYVGGCLIFLQIWCFEHIDIAGPRLMNCRFKFPRVCNWQSTKSHHRGWFTTKFKELETNQIIWSLELTCDESNTDIIKELIETEKRLTWPDMNQRSSVDTSSHIDHTVTHGFQSMVHLTVDLQTESESESNRVAYGMQNLSSDEFSLRETVSRSSVCHYLGTEKELTGRPETSGADVAIVISSDDDWEDDLKMKSLTLEEQIVQLNNKIGELTRENKILKTQLSSSLKFEEQNKKLNDEVENLRQKNQELNLSTNCLVSRLGKIVFDGTTNTLEDESIENNL